MEPEGTPLFCVLTTDKISKRKTYFNFRFADTVPYPEEDINDEDLIETLSGDGSANEQYNIPLKSSPMFWSIDEDTSEKRKEIPDKERFYVIEILINDKFALKKVLSSDVIRCYLITVTLIAIEEKYNKENRTRVKGEFIGHKLDFDQTSYQVLTQTLFMKRSNNFVNNKITILEVSGDSSEVSKGDNGILIYDLYFRPLSKILTCCVRTDELPTSISFNDDRLIVENEENKLLDIFLPIYIDLSEPMRYKFDDKLLLLRIVFKTMEEPYKNFTNMMNIPKIKSTS